MNWVARALLVASAFAPTSPTLANCYEIIGCTDSEKFKQSDLAQLGCQPLWEVRNTIFKENGYCFKSQDAIDALGNDGCSIASINAVKLNSFERHNVALISKIEQMKGCR